MAATRVSFQPSFIIILKWQFLKTVNFLITIHPYPAAYHCKPLSCYKSLSRYISLQFPILLHITVYPYPSAYHCKSISLCLTLKSLSLCISLQNPIPLQMAANHIPLHITANPYTAAYHCNSLSCCISFQIPIPPHINITAYHRDRGLFRTTWDIGYLGT